MSQADAELIFRWIIRKFGDPQKEKAAAGRPRPSGSNSERETS
jgi:hypothetical protein